MSYTVIDANVYIAALQGALSALSASGYLVDPASADYTAATNHANAWAQAIDTAYGAGSVNSLQLGVIQSASITMFLGRSPSPQATPNYTTQATALLALLTQANASLPPGTVVPPIPETPIGPNPYWTVTNWYIDPVGGNDTNAGTSRGAPLKTKAEIARRYGTWNPVINGINVLVTMMNSETNGNDPWLMVPTLINNANYTLTADLPAPSFTGTLNTVTAKNRSTPTPLKSTFTTTTGAVVAGMLLVNSTRGNSRAFAWKNSAGTWTITQPCTPKTLNSFGSNTVEVDTWANGDAITGYVLMDVNVGCHGCNLTGVANNQTNTCAIYNLNCKDFTPTIYASALNVFGSQGWYFVECSVQPIIVGGNAIANQFGTYTTAEIANCYLGNGAYVSNCFVLAGGNAASGNFSAITLSNGVIGSDYIVGNFGGTFTNVALENVYIDSSNIVSSVVNGACSVPLGSVYGGGTLNVNPGAGLSYPSGAGGAVASFPGITLQLGGSTNAYSALTTAGTVAWHKLALSASNLDAAAGAAGFGGYATANGATITNGSVP